MLVENAVERNHPLAPRMAAIAFLSQTTAYGCMFGSFGVLLATVEARTGAGREISSLGVPLVSVVGALLAPVAGWLAGRMSIRRLMMAGALFAACGYALLAATAGIVPYLLAYATLIGPGMCLMGSILPSVLITRWFAAGRGRALGFVHMPILLAVVPPVTTAVLARHGPSAAYGMLAALTASTLLAQWFIVDFPPGSAATGGSAKDLAANGGATTAVLLRSGRFWALVVAMSTILMGTVTLSAHLVPMVGQWGVSAARAAGLLSLGSLAGMVGTLSFGWIADRIGGRRTLAIGCLNCTALWAALLLRPPFPVLALIIALIALHGAAAMPSLAMAISEIFGSASFGRAFGLGSLLCLPFTVAAVPLAAAVFERTGTYMLMIGLQAGILLIGMLLAMAAGIGAQTVPPARTAGRAGTGRDSPLPAVQA